MYELFIVGQWLSGRVLDLRLRGSPVRDSPTPTHYVLAE